jgi:hypothetical protein
MNVTIDIDIDELAERVAEQIDPRDVAEYVDLGHLANELDVEDTIRDIVEQTIQDAADSVVDDLRRDLEDRLDRLEDALSRIADAASI